MNFNCPTCKEQGTDPTDPSGGAAAVKAVDAPVAASSVRGGAQ
jgi:hypothetical protein